MRLKGLRAIGLIVLLLAGASGAADAPADGGSGEDTLNAPDAREPRSLRESRLAARAALRQARLERREAVRAARDSARRLDNFYLGAGLAMTETSVYAGSDSEVTENANPFALWFGYRTHFLPMLGMRAGGLLHFGPTQIERKVPGQYPYDYYYTQVHGSGGMTFELDAQAQAILGPFGRFTVEPGVFYGFGWHTADSIALGGAVYSPRPRFSVAGMMLGGSLFFGRYDQFCPTGFIALAKTLGTADATSFTAGIGFTVAFRDR